MSDSITIRAPGRINIIGEHTDYNGGYVLPTAIDRYIYCRIKRSEDPTRCRFQSTAYPASIDLEIGRTDPLSDHWANYILGVLMVLRQRGAAITGFNISIDSSLPTGSGLSSSAALCCAVTSGLNELFQLSLDHWDIIQIAQRAEHHHIGTACGIMDPFACVMGQAGQALFLNCDSLDYTPVSIDCSPYRFLLINTNVSHQLADSAYNTRVAECRQGLDILRRYYGLETRFNSLRLADVNRYKSSLGPILYNRCRYVVAENQRVLDAVAAIENQRWPELGQLLYHSHDGLRQDYAVSCPELDFLVEYSKSHEEVLGARMMGGGFGGCSLQLIHEQAITAYSKAICAEYHFRFGRPAHVLSVTPGPGLCRITD